MKSKNPSVREHAVPAPAAAAACSSLAVRPGGADQLHLTDCSPFDVFMADVTLSFEVSADWARPCLLYQWADGVRLQRRASASALRLLCERRDELSSCFYHISESNCSKCLCLFQKLLTCRPCPRGGGGGGVKSAPSLSALLASSSVCPRVWCVVGRDAVSGCDLERRMINSDTTVWIKRFTSGSLFAAGRPEQTPTNTCCTHHTAFIPRLNMWTESFHSFIPLINYKNNCHVMHS